MLIQYVNGLFNWAAVACNFIRKAQSRFETGDTRWPVALDDLYLTVVTQILVDIESDSDERSNWMRVMNDSSRVPLTVVEMDALLGLPTKSLATTGDYISPLLPLLKVDGEKKVTESELRSRRVIQAFIDPPLSKHIF